MATVAGGLAAGSSPNVAAGVAAAVDEEAVEGLGEGLDPVGVADEAERRLGLADGDDLFGLQPVEGIDRPGARSISATSVKMP